MDTSNFSDKQEDDEDIKLFQDDYPDVYEIVLMLIDGKYDNKMVENFREGYGEEVYNDIKKIVDGELDDKDVRRFKEEYPEEIYVAIQKIVERKADRLSKAKSQITPYKKGDFIGQKYEVFDILGEGGFGIVYLVYSHDTNEVYALKTFRDEYLEDIQTRERFRKEAQVWIDLERHPYLVRAYFVDELSGRLFIAMEYIAPDEDGLNSLDNFLRKRPPDLAQSLRWAIQFCHGMEYAYSKGLRAHRDIKPANIMIAQDKTVKISDFGLAGVIGSSKAISGIKLDIQQDKIAFSLQTKEGIGFGTPTHMPPEQFINAAGCDEKSDIYSFGVVLYQMAADGKLPFLPNLPKNNSEEESRRFWYEMYELHRQVPVPKLNSPLFEIIQRCLEKEPNKRYSSFKALRAELERILKGHNREVIRLPELKELEWGEWLNKGFSLGALNKYQEAIDCYNKALEMNPNYAKAWCNKGIPLKKLGKYEEAMKCYNKALVIDPQYIPALHNKGLLLAEMGKHQESIDCFNRALEINPEVAGLWNGKGLALGKIGKNQESIECYINALAIYPRYAEAWHNKGIVLSRGGDQQSAVECYDKALEIDPRSAETWNCKGLSFSALENYQEALTCYNKALEIDSKHAWTWKNKGNLLGYLGKHHEAITCFNKAIEIDIKDVFAWKWKGDVLRDIGNYQEAVDCYNQALKLDPTDSDASKNKKIALAKLDNPSS